MSATDYFRRNCWISTECDDRFVADVIRWMGDDHIVFETDFPHPDSKYPHATEHFLALATRPRSATTASARSCGTTRSTSTGSPRATCRPPPASSGERSEPARAGSSAAVRAGNGVNGLRDRAAIVGVGYTPFSKNSGVSTLTLALRAIRRRARRRRPAAGATSTAWPRHRVGDSVQAAVVAAGARHRTTCASTSTSSAAAARSHSIIGARRHGRGDGRGRDRRVLAGDQRPLGVPHGRHRPCRRPTSWSSSTRRPTATRPRRSSSPMYARAYMHSYGATAEDLGRGRHPPARVRACATSGR